MSIDLTNLRKKLYKLLGLDVEDLSVADADFLLNQSWWEIQDKFKFPATDGFTSYLTVVGQQSYTIDPSVIASIRHVAYVNPSTQEVTKLEQLSVSTAEESLDLDVTSRGAPEYYRRFENTIQLYPVPDGVYTLRVTHQKVLADLSTGNTTAPIPRSWHEIILYGAVWRGFSELGDMKQMAMFQNTQATLVSSAIPVQSKEETDTRFAGMYVHGYDYP
jgi:hypothetical protein